MDAEINDEENEQNVKKVARHDEGSGAYLEKVTSYVEEADIGEANIGDVSKNSLR